jgi:hypothetical protein
MRQLIDLRQVRAADTAEKQQDKDNRTPYLFRCQNRGNCRQVKLCDSRLSTSATAAQHGSFPRQLGHQIRCGSVERQGYPDRRPILLNMGIIPAEHHHHHGLPGLNYNRSSGACFLMECREESATFQRAECSIPSAPKLLYLYVRTLHFRLANARLIPQ